MTTDSKNHYKCYRAAEYYDIAFDFRKVPEECEFLRGLCMEYFRSPKTFIEFGAGPALHAIEMARHGLKSTALDLSIDMVRYGTEKSAKCGVDLNYIHADMVTFQCTERFDLAALLMDSASYLLNNDSVIQHLHAVADCLNQDGLYVLEMAHPRDIFGLGKSSETSWEVERGDKKVKVNWGSKEDVFDPLTQVINTSVTLEYWDGADHAVIRETAPQRRFTLNEFDALVRASGRFRIVKFFGAMIGPVPLSNEKEAWRMILVLQKIKT